LNYRRIYLKIIKKAKSENRKRECVYYKDENNKWHTKQIGTYYEAHHILPKSLFPLWKNIKTKSGFKKNGVLLTAREHYFCHQLLDKIYPGEKMFLALWWMSNSINYKITSREYERLKIKFAKLNSERHLGKKDSLEIRQIKSLAAKKKLKEHPELIEIWGGKTKFKKGNKVNLGRHHSKERRENNRQTHLGKKINWIFWNNGIIQKMSKEQPGPEWIKGRLNAKGKVFWNNGTKNMISIECPGSEWIRGRLATEEIRFTLGNGTRGKHWYINGQESKQFFDNEVPDGWVKGRLYKHT
jgi:hypothetical protein